MTRSLPELPPPLRPWEVPPGGGRDRGSPAPGWVRRPSGLTLPCDCRGWRGSRGGSGSLGTSTVCSNGRRIIG